MAEDLDPVGEKSEACGRGEADGDEAGALKPELGLGVESGVAVLVHGDGAFFGSLGERGERRSCDDYAGNDKDRSGDEVEVGGGHITADEERKADGQQELTDGDGGLLENGDGAAGLGVCLDPRRHAAGVKEGVACACKQRKKHRYRIALRKVNAEEEHYVRCYAQKHEGLASELIGEDAGDC